MNKELENETTEEERAVTYTPLDQVKKWNLLKEVCLKTGGKQEKIIQSAPAKKNCYQNTLKIQSYWLVKKINKGLGYLILEKLNSSRMKCCVLRKRMGERANIVFSLKEKRMFVVLPL